jgi:hypothetical protein
MRFSNVREPQHFFGGTVLVTFLCLILDAGTAIFCVLSRDWVVVGSPASTSHHMQGSQQSQVPAFLTR